MNDQTDVPTAHRPGAPSVVLHHDASWHALTLACRIAVLTLPAVVLGPILFERMYIRTHTGQPPRLFEFLALWCTLAIIIAAGWAIRRVRPAGADALPLAGFVIVLFSALQLIAYEPPPSPDFVVYRHAGEAILSGETPYPEYTYPPVFAQTMGHAAKRLDRIAPSGRDHETGWRAVFYLYEILQLCLVGVTYVLLYRAAIGLGLTPSSASILITLLLAVDVPLGATIAWNQANLIVLALVLSALLFLGRVDWLAGLALAFATVIKVYPAAILPVWLLAGQRRVVGWTVFWIACFVVAFGPFKNWIDFLRFWASPPAEYPRTSDSTLFNLLANGMRIAGVAPPGHPPAWIRVVWIAAVLVIIVWGAQRLWVRERERRLHAGSEDGLSLFGSTAEVLAMALLVSPRVWPHQFLYTLPLVVFAAAKVPPERRLMLAIGACLMLAIPWLEVFPAGYHRLAGLTLVLYSSRPSTP